jgi:hypothetical protein
MRIVASADLVGSCKKILLAVGLANALVNLAMRRLHTTIAIA